MRALERGKNLVEIALRLVQRKPAKPVIPAKFNNYGIRMKAQNRRQTRHRVLRRGAAGTLVKTL